MADRDSSVASIIEIIKASNVESVNAIIENNATEQKANRDILVSIDKTLKDMFILHTGFIRRLEQRFEVQDSQPVIDPREDRGPNPVPPPRTEEGEVSLGPLGLAVAGLLGALQGVILGQLKAIKAFAKALTPKFVIERFTKFADNIRDSLRGMRLAVAMNIALIKDALIERFGNIKTSVIRAFDTVSDFIKGAFSGFSGESKIGNVLKSAVGRVKVFVDIFADGLNTVGNILKAVGTTVGKVTSTVFGALKTVGGVASKFSVFGTVMRFMSTIVSKVFAPLAIIITAFDTIKGAIEGFAEGGILGSIEGAIKGFFNSLIFIPADMIKKATAWVLGFFGFDKAKEALNSFSFQETFNNIIGTIFDGIEKSVEWIKTLFTNPVEALKQLWAGYVGLWSGIANWLYDTAIKPAWDWVKSLFGWDKPEDEGEEGFIGKIFNETIEKIKTFFKDVFDFLPSVEEIKQSLMSLLPEVLRPATEEERQARLEEQRVEELERLAEHRATLDQRRLELEREIAEMREAQAAAPAESDVGAIRDVYTTTSEEYQTRIERSQRRLDQLIAAAEATAAEEAAINAERAAAAEAATAAVGNVGDVIEDAEQMREGGVINAPQTGQLAVLHGTEAVIPLESDRGVSVIRDAFQNNIQNARSDTSSSATSNTTSSIISNDRETSSDNISSTLSSDRANITKSDRVMQIMRSAIGKSVSDSAITMDKTTNEIQSVKDALVSRISSASSLIIVSSKAVNKDVEKYTNSLRDSRASTTVTQRTNKAEVVEKSASSANMKQAVSVNAPTVVNKGGNRTTNAPTNNYYISNYSGGVSKDYALP